MVAIINSQTRKNMSDFPFPIEEIKPTDRVACLFCAAFGGQYEVQQIYALGVRDMTLVDIDGDKVQAMGKQFKVDAVTGDAFAWIKAAPDKSYDVVTCDQWTGQHGQVNSPEVMADLKRIAKRVVIVGAGVPERETLDGRYIHRSDFKGGLLWRVVYV